MSQVSVWVPIIVAFVGFAGLLAAQVIANRREDRQWDREREREDQRWVRERESRAEARSDRRLRELANAIAAYAASVTSLRRAEFNRGSERISHVTSPEREPARQETYRLRTEAESKMYLVSLLWGQDQDRGFLKDAEDVIERCHEIAKDSVSDKDLHRREQIAKEALDSLIKVASRRVLNG